MQALFHDLSLTLHNLIFVLFILVNKAMSKFKEEHVAEITESLACSQILAVSYLIALQILFVKNGKIKR